MQAVEHSQLRSRLLSSVDFSHQQGVAMSITVSITAVQSHTPDIGADEILNSCRPPSLISISVGASHPRCWKPHGSVRSFSDWNDLVNSQSLCSYSDEQITVLHKY